MGQGRRVLAGLLTAAAVTVMMPAAAWAENGLTVRVPRQVAHVNRTRTVAQVRVHFNCAKRYAYGGEYSLTVFLRQRQGNRVLRGQGYRDNDAGPCNGRRQTATVWVRYLQVGQRQCSGICRYRVRKPVMARATFSMHRYDEPSPPTVYSQTRRLRLTRR